jgi:energy-coupling factor transporter ATP-binding protein EcfA2
MTIQQKKESPLDILGLDKPFIGLRSYDSTENILFFGRNKQISELLQRLHQTRFLAVVGSSGCGKSSLIKAGLIPKLQGGFLTQERDLWQIAEMRPSNDPLYFLSKSILATKIKDRDVSQSEFDIQDNVVALKNRILSEGTQAVIEALISSKNQGSDQNENIEDSNFLLLVDQFEEIFRFEEKYVLNKDENNKSSTNSDDFQKNQDKEILFVNILLALAEQKFLPIYIIITMRSDYIGNCNQFYGLPEMMNQGQYLVPRLDRQQRQEVIEGPIKLFRAEVTNRLLNRLLNESDVGMDELPVLQHALMRTWSYWMTHSNQQAPLDVMHYTEIGGIENSINQHANEIFDKLDAKQQKIAELIFKALTAYNSEGKAIRNPAQLKNLAGICESCNASYNDVKDIVDRFREPECAFLMPQKDNIHNYTVIDISHESLMRQWNKLKIWMNEEQESARNFKWLSETVKLQELANRKYTTNTLLKRVYKIIKTKRQVLRGMDLKRAVTWKKVQNPNEGWASRYSDNLKSILVFLRVSRKRLIYRSIFNSIFFIIIFFIVIAVVTLIIETSSTYQSSQAQVVSNTIYNKISNNEAIIYNDTTKPITKVKLLQENINLRDSLKTSKPDTALDQSLSSDYGNLSYYQLYTGNYMSVIQSAKKGIELYPNNDWIYGNLALGYLLNKQFNEAEEIYNTYKGKLFLINEKPFKDSFLEDITDLEKAGVISKKNSDVYKEVAKIQEMLNE